MYGYCCSCFYSLLHVHIYKPQTTHTHPKYSMQYQSKIKYCLFIPIKEIYRYMHNLTLGKEKGLSDLKTSLHMFGCIIHKHTLATFEVLKW